jgi:hypothetical protein
MFAAIENPSRQNVPLLKRNISARVIRACAVTQIHLAYGPVSLGPLYSTQDGQKFDSF